MTKKEYIRNSMFYTGKKTVIECMNNLTETLLKVSNNSITLEDSLIIEPSAGNGSFSKELFNISVVFSLLSFDIHPRFEGCHERDFLSIDKLDTPKKGKIVLGFPPVRKYEEFVAHSFKLDADVVAFIMPFSALNKKNLKFYDKNGYSVVFSVPVDSTDFTLPNGSSWDFNGNFIILIKNDHVEQKPEVSNSIQTYRDFFDVYTINKSTLTIKETSQPNLFRDGRVPKNRKTGKPYKILKDENGNKYYHQHGINLDKLDQCQLFLPLRVFPSKQEGMILYDSFDDDTFANIGFGLKVKEGFKVKKVRGKIIYYLYRERYRGIYTLVAKLDEDVVRNFYVKKRYNNGVYVSSKKLIQGNSKGIL